MVVDFSNNLVTVDNVFTGSAVLTTTDTHFEIIADEDMILSNLNISAGDIYVSSALNTPIIILSKRATTDKAIISTLSYKTENNKIVALTA